MKLNLRTITFIFLIAIMYSCIETFEYKTIAFESALVVEASITNEAKSQKIKLTRVFKLEDLNTTNETDAVVTVTDDQGNTFNFNEFSPGEYISNNPFAALLDRKYQLNIITKDNRTYTSNEQEIRSISPIQNITAKAITNNVGGIPQEGISIIAESFDATKSSNFYRYEFEETYKITPPFWSPYELVVISRDPPFKTEIRRKTIEDRYCYVTLPSNSIIITETTKLSEDRVNFSVNFIPKDDLKIRTRYSILVKQYIQSTQAYNFYKVLDKLSSSESLFSQTQPGILIGNVFSNEDANENVLGFFEVTSVSSKRLFLNYTDFFEKGPPGISNCRLIAPDRTDRSGTSPLIQTIENGNFIFYRETEFLGPGANVSGTGPYALVDKSCGDCTVFGSNIKPTFWID